MKPFEPSLPLLPDGPLPVDPKSIERTHQTSVEVGSHSSLGISFQLWASIDMLPIQTDLTAEQHTTKSTTWKFDRIDSEIVVPRLQDVQNAVNREEVVAQINRKMFDFRKRIYMITGVRIARGARLSQQTPRTYGIKARVSVDLAVQAATPITLGPAGHISKTAANSYSFEGSSDFVYAYRVCEIHYGKDVHVRPYNKGETFGVDNAGDEIDDVDVDDAGHKQMRILVEKIASTDYNGAGVAHQSVPVRESEYEGDEEDEFIFAE